MIPGKTNPLVTRILIFLLLPICTETVRPTSSSIYHVCPPGSRVCFFTAGANWTVGGLLEARKYCFRKFLRSWPLEMEGLKNLRQLDEFLDFAFFPQKAKLILNAERNDTGSWMWLSKRRGVDIFMSESVFNHEDDYLFYQRSPDMNYDSMLSRYNVVCMAECKALFISHKNLGSPGGTKVPVTLTECRDLCLESNCPAFEWSRIRGPNQGCRLHSTGGKTLIVVPGNVLYALDTVNMTLERCVGRLRDDKRSERYQKSKLEMYLENRRNALNELRISTRLPWFGGRETISILKFLLTALLLSLLVHLIRNELFFRKIVDCLCLCTSWIKHASIQETSNSRMFSEEARIYWSKRTRP